MSIIFHEGLPGSGKSYEAMVSILVELKKGRAVYAYMEGLNVDLIAKHLSVDAVAVDSLLTVVVRDDVKNIFEIVENDSFVVIDEIQNFWPSGREKLTPGITQFVTEHRHRGLDILVMGQDHRDCHSLWKRRIDKKLSFLKLDALGASGRYRWTASQLTGDKWSKIGGSTQKYDPVYFGLYSSHEAGTDNKSDYKDERFSVWRSPIFRYVIPAFFVLLYFAGSFLVGFFDSDAKADAETVTDKKVVSAPAAKSKPMIQSHSSTAPKSQSEPELEPEPDLEPEQVIVDELFGEYRARLSGVLYTGDAFFAHIDFLDPNFRLKERFTVKQLNDLGWTVELREFGLLLSYGDIRYVVTAWPIDPFGTVSKRVQNSPELRASADGGGTAAVQGVSSP